MVGGRSYRSASAGTMGKAKSRCSEKSRYQAEEDNFDRCAPEDCCRSKGEMGEVQGEQKDSLTDQGMAKPVKERVEDSRILFLAAPCSFL